MLKFAGPLVGLLLGLWPLGGVSVESRQKSRIPGVLLPAPLSSMAPLSVDAGHFRYAMSKVPTDCVDPALSDYPDIKRNLAAIRSARLCYRREVVKEGSFSWEFHIFRHAKDRDGPFWLLPHDDENTAFEAAVYAVDTYGGGFLAIDSGQNRHVRGQDPNRNFSRTGGESMLCREQARPAPKYTAAVIGHFKGHRRFPYLSLHNNANRWAGDGGRGTISVSRRSSVLRGFSSGVATGEYRDEDNLVFIAGLRPYELDRQAQRKVSALNRLGLNVVYKQVTSKSFNCSLSDYVIRNRLGDYYNVEAQHGRSKIQKGMIDRLMKYLGRRPVRGSPYDDNQFLGGSVPSSVSAR
ncbi:MAG: hypothetical protein U9Q81_26390 [Pseudomonadota bacterium]|nr:hypothetical protein [Pseudomonadota bacterium]